MKRVISCSTAFGILIFCFVFSNKETPPIEQIEPKEVEIIETKVLASKYPNPVDLINEEVKYTQNWDTDIEDNTIQISQADAERLLKIAYSEAGNQGVQGQLMVMQTVWNRVMSDKFPSTIESVIEQPFQFSSVSDGKYQKAIPTAETHEALALFESNLNHDANLIGFETKDNGESLLSYFDFYMTYRDHTFYKLKKD